MPPELQASLADALTHVQGFIYPNDLSLWWSVVIVLYPFLTGLVAGAFILASLVRVFNVKALEPIYHLALLTALAFLLVAPLPLLVHLGHPERGYQVMITPHFSSPMAIFGFVYAWYLMAVLLLELWFDYRPEMVRWHNSSKGLPRLFYKILTLGILDVSPEAIAVDQKLGRFITIIGIPSAFLLHGYVGFIFGSVKANPWWGTVLMPVIFIFSAMVSGIALLVVIYTISCFFRKARVNIRCVDTIAVCLLSALFLDAALESLDWIHRLYEAEESIDIIVLLSSGKLYYSLVVIQGLMGTLFPICLLSSTLLFRKQLSDRVRGISHLISGTAVVIGVFAMRWNVVIGGQLFSKSLKGFTTYKLELVGQEGLLMAIILGILPFFILWGLVKIFPPWEEAHAQEPGA